MRIAVLFALMAACGPSPAEPEREPETAPEPVPVIETGTTTPAPAVQMGRFEVPLRRGMDLPGPGDATWPEVPDTALVQARVCNLADGWCEAHDGWFLSDPDGDGWARLSILTTDVGVTLPSEFGTFQVVLLWMY